MVANPLLVLIALASKQVTHEPIAVVSECLTSSASHKRHDNLLCRYSSSLSSVASGGELANRMGLFSDVGNADLMSRPCPVRAA